MNRKQKIVVFWNLIRGGYFAILAGSVYALYRTVECCRSVSFENALTRQALPELIETLAISVLIMTVGGVLGTYLLQQHSAK